MNAHTALEIADKLDYWTRSVMSIHNVPTLPKLCDCGEKAADMLRRQHAEIERLKTVPMKYRRMAFNAQLQEENAQLSEKIERLTALNSTLTAKGNAFVIENARQAEKIDSLTKERDAAIAAAVAAERDACAAVCENGNFLHDAAPTAIFGKECARAIRARSAT